MENAHLAKRQQWNGYTSLILAFRTITRCSLFQGRDLAMAYTEMLARIEDAGRDRDEVARIEAFADAAYLSPGYTAARPYLSEFSAQQEGRLYVIEEHRAEASRSRSPAVGKLAEPYRKALRLSDPMIELLADIANHPMFITLWSRWDRTADALVKRGLAYRPGGYGGGRQYEIRITDEGRAEALRQGITQQAKS